MLNYQRVYIYIYCIIYQIHLDPMTPSVFAVLIPGGPLAVASLEVLSLRLYSWAVGSCWVPGKCGMMVICSMYGIFTYKTGSCMGQMLVNIPYMEHMGWFISIDIVNIIINSPKGVALLKVSAKTCRPKRCSSPSWSQLNNMQTPKV